MEKELKKIPIEEVARKLGCNTINTTYQWYDILIQLEKCGYVICEEKDVKQ